MATNVERIERALNRVAARGVPVEFLPGWKTRGHGPFKGIQTHVVHHTAGGPVGDYPSLRVVRDGRAGLAGPLSQFGTTRSGKVLVFSGQVAWHAGRTHSVSEDNWHATGNEIENVGTGAEPFSGHVLDAAIILAAELQREFGYGSGDTKGHKEVAKPTGRKVDPYGVDMHWFRAQVQAAVDNPNRPWVGLHGAPVPTPAPAPQRPAAPRKYGPRYTGALGGRTIGLWDRGTDVAFVQRVVGAKEDEYWGPGDTQDKVLAWQRANGLDADGLVGPVTLAKMLASVAPKPAQAPAPTPSGRVTLRATMTHPHAGEFQAHMNRHFPLYSRLAVDSVYGPASARVAAEYQRRAGLVADGVVGPKTWNSLGF